jgi:hypothetical protein
VTLPSSPPLSLSQVATELGLSAPLSLGHAWIIALAGKSALPVSMSDLLGKTGRFDGSVFANSGAYGNDGSLTLNNPFFGGTMTQLATVDSNNPAGVPLRTQLQFSIAPGWTGKILAKNNTTGVSVTLTMSSSTLWWSGATGGFPSNFIRPGQTDSFTILPSN